MRSNAAFSKRFKIDVIALLCLFVLGSAVLLHHFPITISSNDDAGTAIMPQQLGQSGILLILPDKTENAQTFQTLDFSFAWYNLLSQYAGPFSIMLARDVQAASVAQAQLIVVPQKSAESLTENQIQAVGQAVQKGASLIIEMPTPEWASLTAVKRRNKVNSAIRHLTDAPNSPLTGAWRDHLLNSPLDTQVLRIDALDSEMLSSDAKLLELDGSLAHYRRAVGSGHVFVLAFSLGQALTAMQQGRPSDNFAIEVEENPQPSDLVMNEKLRTGTVPYADLLKLHVLMSALYVTPMPIVWPFPDGGRAALILVHETGNQADNAFDAAQYEQDQNIASTWLTTPGRISKKTLTQWHASQFDIGVSLLRPPAGRIYEPYGPSFFQPIARERNIANQKKAVYKRLGADISTCKMTGANWARDYTMSFRRLAAANCRIDMSYEPSQPEQYGYLFGSGFPYLPIERNGMPLPVYEFPSVVSDAAGFGTIPPQTAVKLLTESESTFHEPIVASFNADTMSTHPSWLSPDAWLGLIQTAQDKQVWATSAKAFMHHYTLRKQAQVYHAFHPQTKVLDARINLPQANFAYTIAIPRRTIHGTLHDIWVDKKSVDLATLKSTGDGLLMLVPVIAGEHLVQAQYN